MEQKHSRTSKIGPMLTAFADEPRSPPPTSPLPQVPNHPYQIAGLSTLTPPPRPPRPQTSLPNLRPRTITSPLPPRRAFSPDVVWQIKNGPATSSIASPTRKGSNLNVKQTYTSPGSIPSPRSQATKERPSTGAIIQVDDDVISPLPTQFYTVSKPRHLSHSTAPPHATHDNNKNIPADSVWPFASLSPTLKATRPSSRIHRRTTEPKPVARSPLFIPNHEASHAGPDVSFQLQPHHEAHHALQRQLTLSSCPTKGPDPASEADESLTSLPQPCPRHYRLPGSNAGSSPPHTTRPALLSTPYEKTHQSARPILPRPRPKVAESRSDVENGAVGTARTRHGCGWIVGRCAGAGAWFESESPRRIVWAIFVALVVLAATAGIVGGVCFRLSKVTK